MWLLSLASSVFPSKVVAPDTDSEHCVSFIKRHVTFSALSYVNESVKTGGMCGSVLTPYQCFYTETLLFLTEHLTGGQIGRP